MAVLAYGSALSANSAGNVMASLFASSAVSRASIALSIAYCWDRMSNSARNCVSSRTSSMSPSLHAVASLTRSSLTMPPSECCTLLRLPSTLTMASPTTAPFKGAMIAQPPKPAKKTRRMIQPARTAPRAGVARHRRLSSVRRAACSS